MKQGTAINNIVNEISDIVASDSGYNMKDHLDEACAILTRFDGDAKQAMCRAIALIKNLQTSERFADAPTTTGPTEQRQ